MRSLVRVADPSNEALSETQAALWRASASDDLDWFAAHVPLIRDEYERTLGRSLLTASWQLTLDQADLYLPDGSTRTEIILPMFPVVAVSAVTYYDDDDTSATWSTSEYRVIAGDFGSIAPRTGYTWPAPTAGLRDRAALVVAFTAGYGTAVAGVPGPLQIGLRELVTFWYANRGEGYVIGRPASPEGGADVRAVPRAVERVYQRLASWVNPYAV